MESLPLVSSLNPFLRQLSCNFSALQSLLERTVAESGQADLRKKAFFSSRNIRNNTQIYPDIPRNFLEEYRDCRLYQATGLRSYDSKGRWLREQHLPRCVAKFNACILIQVSPFFCHEIQFLRNCSISKYIKISLRNGFSLAAFRRILQLK